MAQHQHIFYGFGSLEKGRAATKKNRATPKNSDHSMAIRTVASNGDEQPISSVCSEVWNSLQPKKSRWRLNDIILKSVKNLNEPTGSHRTTIANYIEEQYRPSDDFDHILSAKLKDLITSGKLIKVNRKYRIAPALYSEERNPKILLLEDVRREPLRIGNDDSKDLTKYQVNAELAHMLTMTAEEAASTAARAVIEAEAEAVQEKQRRQKQML